jgi:hypothetical protein
VSSNEWFRDMALQRQIKLSLIHGEKAVFTMGGEFFNAFNHANFFVPSLDLLDHSFGDKSSMVAGGKQIKITSEFSF